MDPGRDRAEANLEIIRTLMERSTKYEHLSARAGLQVGTIAVLGSASFYLLDPKDPLAFGLVWAVVFLLSLMVMVREHVREVRESGLSLWTRPAREIVRALLPAFVAALVLSIHGFRTGRHLELPGIWMLCYGCGALATATYAPAPVASLGTVFLVIGSITLFLGPPGSIAGMALAFGGGHLFLGIRLLAQKRRGLRLVHSIAEPAP